MFDLLFEHVNAVTHVRERQRTVHGPFARVYCDPDTGNLTGFDEWYEPTVDVPVTNEGRKLATFHRGLWYLREDDGSYAISMEPHGFNRFYIVSRDQSPNTPDKATKRRTVILEKE